MKKFKYLLLAFLFSICFFKPQNTYALEVYTDRFNDAEFNISSTTNYWYNVSSNFNNWWNGWGAGYIRFNYTITKISGSSTSSVAVPHSVLINTGQGSYICDIGSVSVTNSTWIGQTYSAYCPVDFTAGHGLNYINFNFDRGTGDNSSWHVWVDGHVTYEKPSTLNIPNTTDNDNNNTNKVIAEQQKILQEQQKTTQATKDVENTIKDDNIDTSGASDIFGLELEENSTLSSVITAPLGFLNSLSNTCSEPLSIPIFNTSFNLPCGSIFWERGDVQIFRVIWNLLLGGSIIYTLCTKLFKVVHDALNPNKDEVNTLEV